MNVLSGILLIYFNFSFLFINFKNIFYNSKKDARSKFFLGCFSVVFFVLVLVVVFIFIGFERDVNVIQAQSAPNNLSLRLSGSDIVVSWTASTGADVLGYELQYCSGTSCTPSTTVNIDGRTTNSYTLTNLTSGLTYRVRIRAKERSGITLGSSWTSSDKPSGANNLLDSFVDTENNKIWLFNDSSGAYYKSINSSGVPTGSWSSADKPESFDYQFDGQVDTENDKVWLFGAYAGAYYKSLNASGVPTGSWSSADKPTGSRSLQGGLIDEDNSKLWLFSRTAGAYYKSLNSSGAPTGTWSGADEPSDASSIQEGFVDATNNKLWLFDRYDGAYYKSLNASGVPTGSWSSADKPTDASYVQDGFVDAVNSKLWLFDRDDGAYHKSLNASGVPTGSWSSATKPLVASTLKKGVVDTENSKVWLMASGAMNYLSFVVSYSYSPWTSTESQSTFELPVPSGVSFTSGLNSVSASWTANTHSSVTGYKIKYCQGASCNPETGTLVTVSGRTTTSRSITGLTSDTLYRIIIQATGSIVDSSFTAVEDVRTSSLPVPTGLSLTNTATSVSVSWTSATNSNVTGYKIKYCEGASCNPETVGTIIDISDRTTNTYSITGLTPSATYRIAIQAFGNNITSSFTAPLNVTMASLSIAGLRVSSSVPPTVGSITIEWDANSDIDVYTAQYCSSGTDCRISGWIGMDDETGTTARARGLQHSKEYKFRVSGFNNLSSYNTLWYPTTASTASLTTDTNLRVGERSDDEVVLEWEAPSGVRVSSYDISVCEYNNNTDNVCNDFSRTISNVPNTFVKVRGLSSGKKHRFKVGVQVASGFVAPDPFYLDEVYTLLGDVENIRLSSDVQNNTTIKIVWNAVTSATSYKVQYCLVGNRCSKNASAGWSESTVTSASFTARGLTRGVEYTFRVKAYNGTYSPSLSQEWSEYKAYVVLSATCYDPNSSGWSPSTPFGVTSTSKVITGLEMGKNYSVRVRSKGARNTTSNWVTKHDINLNCDSDSDCESGEYCSSQTYKCQPNPSIVSFTPQIISQINSAGFCDAKVRLIWISNLKPPVRQAQYEIQMTSGSDSLSSCSSVTTYPVTGSYTSSSNSISFDLVSSIDGGTPQNPINISLSGGVSLLGNRMVFGKKYCAQIRINDGVKWSPWKGPVLVSSPIKSYPSSSFTHIPSSVDIEEVATITNTSQNSGKTMQYDFYVYEIDLETNQYKPAINASLSASSDMSNSSNKILNYDFSSPLYVRYDVSGRYEVRLEAIDLDLAADKGANGNGTCTNRRSLGVGIYSRYGSPIFQEVPSDF